jgi:hypothetical protein
MLSAAAAVLFAAAPLVALADVTVSAARTDPLTTTASGNITIDANGGAMAIQNNGAALTLDSNNFILNNGLVSNINNSGSIGIQIDLTNHNVVSQSPGLLSTNAITVAGTGESKVGVLVVGGNTFFGNITLTNSTGVANGGSTTSVLVTGDNSSAFRLSTESQVDGDVTFGGAFTVEPSAKSTSTSGNTLFMFNGEVNGNVYFDASVAANSIGQNSRGIQVLGGIHACSNANTSAAQLAVGYACPSGSGRGLGALINAGKLVTAGQVFIAVNAKDADIVEAGSVLLIGSSIDGGFYNSGPATSAPGLTAGVLSGSGYNGSSVLYIDPNLAGTNAKAINIGTLDAAIDPGDPGYSILNRGTIVAQPSASQRSTSTVFMQGASTSFYTCLGNGDFAGCGSDGKGGILNTGTISALATTNATSLVTVQTTATAITIGPYAAIPRLDVRSQVGSPTSSTPGTILASVSGSSGGIATAVVIGQNAKLPTISVGANALIEARVETSTTAPTSAVATSSAPFTLVATAISDGSGSLTKINNAGTIRATVTSVNPAIGAVVVTSVRAIDLTASTADNITINNSGRIAGDLYFGSGGNGYTLNVGNTGGGGAGNAEILALNMGGLNTPSNYAIVAGAIGTASAGSLPPTSAALINFGAGSGHVLRVGAFGYVNAVVQSNPGGVAVTVENNGTLFVSNTVTPLYASTFNVAGGTLGLTVSQNTTASSPVIKAATSASVADNSTIALQFGSFISSGFTRTSVDNPVAQDIVLISAPTITVSASALAQQNLVLAQNLPFLFQANSKPLDKKVIAGNEALVLSLKPRAPGPTNSDGTPGLNLSGDALAQFPYVASALATDASLGSAIATSLTVYNTPGVSSSGINVAASQQQAQQAFSQFGPDTSGGAKQVAIMITDQATGPVAARQRLLRSYSHVPGEMTLWGEEFFGNINNKGRVSADGSLTNFKDHGFGFTVGLDGGSPRGGWYGGAFTFYSGDVSQTLPRSTQTNTQWYMLTGYSQWQGKRLFVDTQISVGYGDFIGYRDLAVGTAAREAQGKRAVLMGALGGKMGAVLGKSAFSFTPYVSLDALTLREEGYTETGGGNGFNLQVAPYYANSLRTAFGVDLKSSMRMFGISLVPEARFGYRYDLVNSPVKLRAGFVSTGGLATAGNAYTFVGPDPDTGNMFGGFGLGAGTESWQLGVNFDMVRGNNGSTTQIGTITLLGRI